MRRREFISLVGGALAAWPFAAPAQQPALPVVAVIQGGGAEGQVARLAGFRKGLNATGYAEGQNATVEYHWLQGDYERLPALLADLVRRRVSVVATLDTPSALSTKNANTTIPIVFAVGEDPVALGLVANLAQPGGNATGINFFSLETNAKRLGLMHELLPKATRFVVLLNPASATSASATSQTVKEAARALGLETLFLNASTASEIDAAFATLAREPTDALFIQGDGFFTSRAVQLATLAVRDRIPASYSAREMVEAGLLMSYGTNFADTWRQVGVYAGSILKGAKPAELPVLQSTVINLQTAKSVGIEVPPTLLARADEVIE
jgi:putative ABC transport system substrate-binding protein